MSTRRIATALTILALATTALGAQQQPPQPPQTPGAHPKPPEVLRPPERPRFTGPIYKVDLTITELDGTAKVNSRTYAVLARSDDPAMLRVGSRVPVAGERGSNYMNVGLKVDLSAQEIDGRLAGILSVELNTLVLTDPEKATPRDPIIRDLQVRVPFSLTPGKPSIVSTVDDVNSTHKFQLEMLATRM